MAYITAIRMGPGSAEEHIATCSVLYDPGTTHALPPASIVSLIDKGYTFVVGSPNGPVAVGAVRPAGKPAYIRTHADGVWTNNLLALPRF